MLIKDPEGVRKALEAVAQYRKEVEKEAGHRYCDICNKRFPATDEYFNKPFGQLGKTCKICAEEVADLERLKNREQWKLILHRRGLDFCGSCGYNRCSSALELHHVNPLDKEANIGSFYNRQPTEEMIKELDKCICLCANCHRELHYKLRLGLVE